MSLVCKNVTKIFFCRVVFFPAVFSAGLHTCLVAWTSFMPLDRFAARLKKRLEINLHDWNKFVLHLCKLETYLHFTRSNIWAIDNNLVAGWKHASFLCYSMGARWFLRFLGPKLELPRSSTYSPYLRCLWLVHTFNTLYLPEWHLVLLQNRASDGNEFGWDCCTISSKSSNVSWITLNGSIVYEVDEHYGKKLCDVIL